MQPRGHRRQPSTCPRRPVHSLSLREALVLAEVTIRQEAEVWALAPSAGAQERAADLHRRANQLRQQRERLP